MNFELKQNDLVLVGICSDQMSSFKRGAALAPPAIRSALFSTSTNLTSESGIDLSNNSRFVDFGDIIIADDIEAFMEIGSHINSILSNKALPLVLGGDHAITYPIIQAISKHHGPIDILHFDAHPDLYDELNGNRLSHACPFARIMEEKLVKRLVQVGIRTLNKHQSDQAKRFGVEFHEMKSFDADTFNPNFSGPIYISFDMDVLDPAYAPGVGHYEPGGMSVRDVIKIIHKLKVPIIGADIVEYNPNQDINNMTAMVAAKLVKEIGGMMIQNTQ
jgi:arginase